MIDNLPTLLFLVPFALAVVTAATGLVRPALAVVTAVAGLLLTFALACVGLAVVARDDAITVAMAGWPPPVGIELVLDPVSAFMALLVGALSLVVTAGSHRLVKGELAGLEPLHYACTLIVTSGLMGIVVTGDLFNLFVQLEVASLAAYALVAAGGKGAPRAALNYLLMGSLGASLYLLGVCFLYAATGSLNMADVAVRLPATDVRLGLVAGVFIVGGLGIKMALFPLHMWMPAAYSRAPAAGAAFMAPLFTKVSAYAILRILLSVYGFDALAGGGLLLILTWGGALAVVMGGVMALVQSNWRRLLAYSSVGQMGIVAMCMGLGSGSALSGALFHMAADGLAKGVLFLAAGVALVRFGVENVQDLAVLRRAPWTAAAVTVAVLSLVGVPPLVGFFGKWYVLVAAVEQGRWELAAAVVAGSLLAVGYGFRILEPLLFGPPPDRSSALPPLDPSRLMSTQTACVLMAVAAVVAGVTSQVSLSFLAPSLGLR